MSSSEKFSTQERKVIELLLKGKSNKEMAVILGVAARTIEFHLSNIYKKLEVSSRIRAVLKLSEEQPRKSTGTDLGVDAGESTVDKTEMLRKNGVNTIQLWRQKVPNALYFLITVVMIVLVLGVGRLLLGSLDNPIPVAPQVIATPSAFPLASDTPRSSPIALHSPSPTTLPILRSSATVAPRASPSAVSTRSGGSTCKGAMPAIPAGPTINLSLANNTKANITVSLFLAKNKFGDCGYKSYVLAQMSSISLTEVLPYGCYYTYVIINDPRRPTHVTSGPDCITEPNKITFTVTYDNLKISPSP